MIELVNRSHSRRAAGSLLLTGDLPHARLLRGEVVGLGEMIEITPLYNSVRTALATSAPMIRSGTVLARAPGLARLSADVKNLADRLPKDT